MFVTVFTGLATACSVLAVLMLTKVILYGFVLFIGTWRSITHVLNAGSYVQFESGEWGVIP
jgi:hypothetical protein